MGPRLFLGLVALVLLLSPPDAVCAVLAGRVVDENGVPVPGARILLQREGRFLRAESGDAGQFELKGVEPGVYSLRVEMPGYYALTNPQFSPPAGRVDLVINHLQEFQERITVSYSPPATNPRQVRASARLDTRELLEIPYPSSHDFRNGLVALPGVVQDSRNKIHLNGGAEDQVLYTLNGFNLTDGFDGTLVQRIPVDAIREVQVQSSRYSAEFGKSTAGTLDVESGAGDDRLRYAATNFVPSGTVDQGFHLTKWTPRGSVSGPWRRGRAWFFNAADTQYSRDQISGLPKGRNNNARWSTANLLRNRFLLGKSNLLGVTWLFNRGREEYYGLGAMDPQETTRRFHQLSHFVGLKDQQYLAHGVLLEVGLAVSRQKSSAVPLGAAGYVIAPDGRSGNHFESSRQITRRRQALANVIIPGPSGKGQHEFKVGVDLNWTGFERTLDRRPFQVMRSDGTLWHRVYFMGDPSSQRGGFEQSFYAQDRWLIGPRWTVQAGVRQDFNGAVGRSVWAPRLALAFAPFAEERAKLTVGWGAFYGAAPLEVLSRDREPVRYEQLYSDDGLRPLAASLPMLFLSPRSGLKLPRANNVSVGWDQRTPGGFLIRGGFLFRRTDDVLAYLATTQLKAYSLGNRRKDRYHAWQIAAERALGKGSRWMASYTRSSARSNALLSLYATSPVYGVEGEGPLDWDSPNRFLSWAWFPLGEKWGLSYMVEWRTGYPFTVFSEKTGLVGPPNDRRYPDYFNLNLEVERRFRIGRYQWALRGGFINITDHSNPNAVNNTVESPGFLHYAGGQSRAIVTRIRLIGRN